MIVKPYRVIVALGLSWLLLAGQATFSASVAQAAGPESNQPNAHDRQVLFEEMPFVQLLSEQDGYAKTVCAGSGLNNVKPSPEGPIVLIPNAGDLSLDGSNVAIKLDPSGQITFIPRTQGQLIRVPLNPKPGVSLEAADDTDDNGNVNKSEDFQSKEVPSLTLDDAMQFMASGHLVWTAKNQGPYGNGYGLPGHIAACDPQFNEDVYKDFTKSQP
jgi:hypothetical protein